MILDSEKQRNLLLGLISDHVFNIPGKILVKVAMEVQSLEKAIFEAKIESSEEDEA